MRAVILSGGSEIISVALVEEFLDAKIPFAIVSLGGNSLLRHVLPDVPYGEIGWPPESPEQAARSIHRMLVGWGDTTADPWPVFPTEDGGLRLLLQYGRQSPLLCKTSQAHRLKLGGLDKAELFDYLLEHGCADAIVPTKVINNLDEVIPAMSALGGDCVIKPALKPLSMRLTGMAAKAFLSMHYRDELRLLDDLARAWALSDRWVVQTRMYTPAMGELVFWAVRDGHGKLAGLCAVERWKQPRAGGTGCWVETNNSMTEALWPQVEKILAAIDYRGLCELAFLLDTEGNWRLLELNPRPWLQVGLARHAGANLGSAAVRVLQGDQVGQIVAREGVSWVNAERLLLAALSGDYGSRAVALGRAYSAWRHADLLAVYSSLLPRIRTRWLARMVGKALKWWRP